MYLTCIIMVGMSVAGETWISRTDSLGEVLKRVGDKYIVDFSEDLSKRAGSGIINPESYTRVIVDKYNCDDMIITFK